MIDRIKLLLKAKTGLIYLVSYEEERIEDDFILLCHQLRYGLYSWDINKGYTEIVQEANRASLRDADTTLPYEALSEIQRFNGNGIFILKDFHRFLDPSGGGAEAIRIIRSMRNLVRDMRAKRENKTIVIVAPTVCIPDDLEHDLTLVEYELPDYAQLTKTFLNFVAANRLERSVDLTEENLEKLIKSMRGLTTVQAERAIAKIFVRHGKIQNHHIDEALAEKKQIISKRGVLEYIEAKEKMEDIGGLENLKEWLRQREMAFTERARAYGLPTPKGILLVGVQGVGKSLTAKAVSSLWNLPLIRLDVGRVFGSLVGESEERIREAIRLAEAVSPSVLWIDEIDKAFAGVRGEQGDSGTSARVFGSILTWMQEKVAPVFVVATANNVVRFRGSGKSVTAEPLLPPELLRKGRFDEIFFLDLPSRSEREDIFRIMHRKYALEKELDFARLAEKSGGFVDEKNDLGYGGAELEQIIIEAMFHAFYEDERSVTDDDILRVMNETKPLYDLMKDDIDNLRRWAGGRTRPAS